MKTSNIKIVRDFHPKPYGRYPEDGEGCGQFFREKILAPAMRTNDKVFVDLNGYNRYGRSFLDEAFGGLIRESGFTGNEVKTKLTYRHDLVKSIETLIAERIDAAIKDCE
jgi:hypothetical protein